jgi:perosamine synthetase
MIPVFEPAISEADIEAVVAALRRGEISGSFGESIAGFEAEFAAYVGCRHGVAVTSGTTALHLAVAALDLPAGAEVLVSASTNIATALACYHNDCVAVAVDSEEVTWNLDLDRIESLITPATRAIIPVHLFGHPVAMDRLMAIADRHGLKVIEDCAESHGATWLGRMTGAFGHLSCFSFYANKIITTGEGGMVLTDDAALAERLRLLRNLAFGKPRFLHQIAGYQFRMTGMQAALGRSQLRRIEDFVAAKRRVAQAYNRHLAGVRGIRTPAELPGARNVYWMYAITCDAQAGVRRDALAAALAADGIETRTFFCPMNRQPFLRAQPGFRDPGCPVADRLWEEGLYLPSSCDLDEEAVAGIAAAVARAAG